MPDPRKDFALKLLADDPSISDEDLTASLKVYDTHHPPGMMDHARGVIRGVVKGAGDVTGVGSIVELAKLLPGAVSDIAANAKSGAQSFGKSLMEADKGASEAADRLSPVSMLRGALTRPVETAKGLDPGQGTTDPWEANARRATNVAGLFLGSKAVTGRLGQVGRAEEVAAASKAAKAPAFARPAEISAIKTMTGETPNEGAIRDLLGKDPTIPPALAKTTGTGATTTTGTIPAAPMRVSPGAFARPSAPVVSALSEVPEATDALRDRNMRGVTNDFTKGKRVTIEKPSPTVPPAEPSIAARTPAVPEVSEANGALRAEMDAQLNGKGTPPPITGFDKIPTKGLKTMVEQFGKAEAANRARMTVPELEARIAAGGDPDKLRTLLADRIGSEKTARALGEDVSVVRKARGEKAGKLPSEAVSRIKAKAAEELATDGKVSDQTQTLLDRIKSERGAAKVSGLIVGGGATGGAVLGGAAPAKDNDDRLWNAIGGGLVGAGLGAGGSALASAPSGALSTIGKNLLAARQAGFLSGGALVKHGLTGAGAALSSAVEAPGTSRGAALTEMLRFPTNIREFGKSWKAGAIGPYGTDPDVLPALKIPNRLIGSAIDTQHKALARAGVPQADIDRYLLTKNNSLFGGMQDLDNNGMRVARTLVPFSRVPANLFTEGANALGDLAKGTKWKTGGNALTLASMGGGAALQKWAGTDPRKIYVARLLLAGFGPRALPAIMGGLGGAALSGNISARKTIGDISPIPEVESAKSLIGYKPALWTALQKLGVVATPEK